MAGRAPRIVVLALGAAAVGGPDALRALLEFAGQSPVVDIAICVFVIGMFTALLLGVVLLARFVRKAPRAQGGGGDAAPGTDLFAKMTLVVSVGVAFLVSACLVVVSGGGLMSSVRTAFHSAGKSSGSFVAAGILLHLCITPLLRVSRGAASSAARATDCVANTTQATVCLAAICLLLAPFVAPGGLDAVRHFSAVSINTLTIVGAVLLVLARVSLRPVIVRFLARPKTPMAVVCIVLAYFLLLLLGGPGGKSHACSA
ncbi:hypothetical protein PR202_ga17841 [Eleusine coracana subsp. coracana]|uniref:Uncharacterized protein n=1 Tax=Eleusine coracana subsp. coracana TaxID=191504 RepID=A0AAV5CRL4_ELECO|nr:hypothetical protein QOZ80_6AG0512630 [Eleusine coracana subsp. coracana]GJN00645.1 hypothetical protein PR202_ga17841 [Eleusine coracana subsp. coracana]